MNNINVIATKDLIHTSISTKSKIKNIKEFLLTNIYIDRVLNHDNKYLIGYDKSDNNYFVYAYLKELLKEGITFPYVFLYKMLDIQGDFAVINTKDKSLTLMRDGEVVKVYSFDITYESILEMVSAQKVYIVNEEHEGFETLKLDESSLLKQYVDKNSKNNSLNIVKKNYKMALYIGAVLFLLFSFFATNLSLNYNKYKQIEDQVVVKEASIKSLLVELSSYESLANTLVVPHIYHILNKLKEFKIFLSKARLDNNVLQIKLYSRFDGNIIEYLAFVKGEYKIVSSKIEFKKGYYFSDLVVKFE